jgi:hypothetical protein
MEAHMKPTLTQTMIPTLALIAALALAGCTRTDDRMTLETIPTAQAANRGTLDPLAYLPPISPNAEDREIVDYQ